MVLLYYLFLYKFVQGESSTFLGLGHYIIVRIFFEPAVVPNVPNDCHIRFSENEYAISDRSFAYIFVLVDIRGHFLYILGPFLNSCWECALSLLFL